MYCEEEPEAACGPAAAAPRRNDETPGSPLCVDENVPPPHPATAAVNATAKRTLIRSIRRPFRSERRRLMQRPANYPANKRLTQRTGAFGERVFENRGWRARTADLPIRSLSWFAFLPDNAALAIGHGRRGVRRRVRRTPLTD